MMRFVTWSYTGCHLQSGIKWTGSSGLKGGQELLQSASLLKAVKKLRLHHIALIPDKLLHVDKLMVFKLY